MTYYFANDFKKNLEIVFFLKLYTRYS